MKLKSLWIGLVLVGGLAVASEPVNVLDLGVKNDGSADVSVLVNAASAQHALYFPAGLYKVSHPLKIANSVTGVGYARLPHVDATRTWFLSDLAATNANCAVIEVRSGRLINLENFNLQLKGREKGISLETTQGRFFTLNGIGIYGVASTGLDVHGGGSRPVFADRLTIFGSRSEPQKSRGVSFRGSVDCRISNTEVMGVCVALEVFNGHTYGSNLHLWTGVMGGPKNDPSWWKETRGILLGPGANFAGSQIYPDTCYYAIAQEGDGAICELSNVMYWEDGSVKHVMNRTGTFYHRPPNTSGKLILKGGLIGVGGNDSQPGCTRSYMPHEAVHDVMLKSDYAIKAGNLDWLCTGDVLPDYAFSYADAGWCKVADIVMESPAGACVGTIAREDGTAWRVAVSRAAGAAAKVAVTAATPLADLKAVQTREVEGVVRVYVRSDSAEPSTFRFHTESMGTRFRPIDHGTLRAKSGKARYREVRTTFAEALPPLPKGAFTLAVIPDTQRYEGEGKRVKPGKKPATGPVRNDSFVACVDWILANQARENIFFVSHTGDISDNKNDPQFAFAAKQMSRFDGKIPYGIAPGNHDLVGASTDLFCKYFPAAKFEKESWYAGHFGGYTNQAGAVVCRDNADSCQLVEAGGVKFVILHVECNAPDPVLAWVDAQLAKYADRVAIIATHQDLGFLKKEYQDAWNADGAKKAQRVQNLVDEGKPVKESAPHPDRAQLGRLQWKKCHGTEGNTPQQAWEKCYSKHKNVFLILSGDEGPVNVAREITTGVHGNRVFAAMHDNQTHSIRLYRFYPNLEKIEVWTVNPATGEVLTSYRGWTDRADHNFTWQVKSEQK